MRNVTMPAHLPLSGMAKGREPGPNVWIATELKNIQRTQAELARHLGVSESVMSKLINRRKPVDVEQDRKIRDFLVTNAPQGATGYALAHSTSSVRRADAPPIVSRRNDMPEDLPVFGTALGGSDGGTEFIMNGQAALYVRRPEKLAGRDDVFALYVQGDSMEPRFFEGELIICETNRPPSVGDFVVVEMKEAVDGFRVAYLKRLAGRSGGKLRLKQYNPDKVLELEMDAVHQVVRVLNTHDLVS